MFKEFLNDSKSVTMVITSVGGILLAAYAIYLMATVVSSNTAAVSQNTVVTSQMSQLLIQVLSSQKLKTSFIQDIKEVVLNK